MRESRNLNKTFVIIVVLFFLLDRLSKELVKNYVSSKGIDLGFLSIDFISNTGSAFGLFKNNNAFFILVTFLVLFLLYFYRKDFMHDEWKLFFVSLVTAGALGNLFDRLFYGSVIDFINFHFWPAFNVADSCISVGVVGLVLLFWKD